MATRSARILLGVALLLLGGSLGAEVNLPEIPRGKGEECVAPTDIMRKYHGEFLTDQRNFTVREGVRSGKYNLVGCIECHVQKDAQGEFIPIDAPGQFCQACHQYTATKIDCFECHATTPDETNNPSGLPPVHDWSVVEQEHELQLACTSLMPFNNAPSNQELRQDFMKILEEPSIISGDG